MTHEDVSKEHHETPLDWRRAHEALSRLAKTRAALDWEEGTWLLCALRSGAHTQLGFGSFAEYIERLFGYTPRWTAERVRVAEALEHLPELSQSLRDATLTWSAVRELARVATRQTENDWLNAARDQSLRQIEQLVAGHKLGDRPTDDANPALRRHVLRFEVSGDVLATFREAMAKLRHDSDDPLDDDAALLLMARQILGGPSDAGRASYQIALTICERCGRGWQQGRAELVEVGHEVVEMAACDAQHIGGVSRNGAATHRARTSSVFAAADIGGVSRNGAATHVGQRPSSASPPRVHQACAHQACAHQACAHQPRAHQNIPPRIRREVMRRDGGRCVVPGCCHAVFVDLHHLEPRSEGGTHDPDKIVTLCGAHHRAQHRGQLIIEGSVSTGLTFRHADGSIYGSPASPDVACAHQKAFSALRHMGFRETEARRALECVRAEPHAHVSSTESILRAALAVLTPV